MPPLDMSNAEEPLDLTNAGLYRKPSTGIPISDLEQDAQDVLNIVRERIRKPVLSIDFLVATGSSAIDPFLGIGVASGTINQPNVVTADHPGVIRLLSSTSADSGYFIGTNTGQLLLAGGERYDAIFNITQLTNVTIRAGFHDAGNVNEPTDGAYIIITSDGTLTGRTRNNSVESNTATTAAVVINTWYHIKIELNDDATLVTFTLTDDAGTVLWTNTLATNIPTAAGRETGAGFVATHSATSAVSLVHLDFMGVTFGRALLRGEA